MIGLLFALAPVEVIVEQDTVAYTLDEQRISIPAGTVIEACIYVDNKVLIYELASKVLRVPAPCDERPIFADGFEQ